MLTADTEQAVYADDDNGTFWRMKSCNHFFLVFHSVSSHMSHHSVSLLVIFIIIIVCFQFSLLAKVVIK